MLKAIIFDCFGVLYPHSSGDFFARHKKLFQSYPDIMDTLNLKIDLGEINRSEFFAELEAVTGVSASLIQNEFDIERKPDKNLIALIKKLKTKYKIGLLSNAGKEEIEIIYRDKINDLFDAKTISYEVKSVKPNPPIFMNSLDKLQIEPQEALFVDDSMVNIHAASKLGITTVYYPEFGAIPRELTKLV